MAHLAIENLTFAYAAAPERPVLDGVTLQVQQGEYIALCGRSGSGKTTLLRHLKTALAPHGVKSGRILLDGQELESVSLRIPTPRSSPTRCGTSWPSDWKT